MARATNTPELSCIQIECCDAFGIDISISHCINRQTLPLISYGPSGWPSFKECLLLLVRGYLGCLGQHSLLGNSRALRYRLDGSSRALSDEKIAGELSRWDGFRSMSSSVRRSTVFQTFFDVELMWTDACEIESDTEYHRVTTQSLAILGSLALITGPFLRMATVSSNQGTN